VNDEIMERLPRITQSKSHGWWSEGVVMPQPACSLLLARGKKPGAWFLHLDGNTWEEYEMKSEGSRLDNAGRTYLVRKRFCLRVTP